MEYQYIVNPQTGRRCRTNSRLGRQIIKNYSNQKGGTCENCPNCIHCNKLKAEIADLRNSRRHFQEMLLDCYSKLNDTQE